MSDEVLDIVPVEKNPLAFQDTNPAQMGRRARDVASAAREIVKACTQRIGGRDYLKVEGWMAIANLYGCVGSAGGVEKVEGGWVSTGSVVHVATGRTLVTGEGFVGEDEKVWMSRPMYARRGMTQTRAISRACRAAFAFVVPMIDAKLQTTPAEEIPDYRQHEQEEAPAPAHHAATGEVIDEEEAAIIRYREAATPTQRAKALLGLSPEVAARVKKAAEAA